MKKHGKTLRLFALVFVLIAFAAAVAGCAAKEKPDPDPGADDYDVKYASSMPSGTDDGITIDGKADESVYAGQKTFVNYLSEDVNGTDAHISTTVYVGEKGWYIITEVVDPSIVYNGLLAPARNSTIHLYYLPDEGKDNSAIREIYMDAGRVYGRTPCNIGYMEYGVGVNGEINGSTTSMTAELFIPWKAMGFDEKPENTDLAMYPTYIIPKGGGDYRNLSPLPSCSGSVEQYYLFGRDGYSDKDADGAALGDAQNGHVKAGVWTLDNIAKTEENGKVSLSGSASIHAATYAKTYIKDIYAENYIVEATVKVTGRDYGKRDGRAGLTVDIPGGKRKSFAVFTSAEDSAIQNGKTLRMRSFYADDYDGRNNSAAMLPSHTIQGDKTFADGVKLTLIKSGANIYGLADGEIVLAETDNAIRGKCYANLSAANVNVEFTDITYAVYDGREDDFVAAVAAYGMHRVTAETDGYGEVTVENVAVKTGGDVTFTVECGEGSVIKEVKINDAVVTDFAEKAEVFGTEVKYTISDVTTDVHIVVKFEEYAGVKVCGTISIKGKSGINMSDAEIYAFRADGSVIPFDGATEEDGSYQISLAPGSYDKIRIIAAGYANEFATIGGEKIVIGSDDVTGADFELVTPAPTVRTHGEGSGKWTMTADKEYYVSPMSHGNAWIEGGFGTAKNFVISARIETDSAAEAGVSLFGSYMGNKEYDVMVRMTAGGKMGVSLYGWAAGWASADDETCKVGKSYNANDFKLTVVRNNDTLSVFVDDVLWKTYTGKISSNLDFSDMGEMRVGLAVRGTTGVTFSDYSFSANQSDVDAVISRVATVGSFDDANGNVTITGIANGRANIGAEVRFDVVPASGKFIRVLADGVAVSGKVNADGSATYTYRMTANDVAFTYDVKDAFAVGGTIPVSLSGATVSVVESGATTVYNDATDGTDYSIVLPNGTYDIIFTASAYEGMIKAVSVDGAAVTADLDKAYVKVTGKGQYGGGSNSWTMTGNGEYTVTENATNDWQFTFGEIGVAEGDFVTRVRITGGESAHVGVNLQAYDKVGTSSLFVMKVNDGIQFKGWQFGWNKDDSGFRLIKWETTDEKKDYYYTVARYDGKLYVMIGNETVSRVVGVFDGEIAGNEKNVNTASLGKLRIGFGIFGDSNKGLSRTVTFSDYSFSVDATEIEKVVKRSVSVAALDESDGTVTISGIADGSAVIGDTITVGVTPKEGFTIIPKVNGSDMTEASGAYTYTVSGKETSIAIAFAVSRSYNVSGTVPTELSGAAIKATSSDGNTLNFASAVAADGTYSVFLPDGTYSLVFTASAYEGMIKSVTVNGAAITASLDKAYNKVTQAKYGGGAKTGYGDWTMTDNGTYTVTPLADGDSYSLGVLGKAKQFIVSARIRGGNGKGVGIGMQYDSKNLLLMKVTGNNLVQFYSWQGGWAASSGITWGDGNADDFVYTVIRYDGRIYAYVNGTLVGNFYGKLNDNHDLSTMGETTVGLLLRGNAGSVTFSDYSFSTDSAAIEKALGLVAVSGKAPSGVSGSVTATAASGATYTGTVADGAYSVTVAKNAAYKLYFDCGNTEGLIPAVTVAEANVTAAEPTLAQKVSWIEKGNRTISLNSTGSYTVTDNTDGARSFGLMGTTSGDFMISTGIKNGKGRHVGVAIRYGENNGTFLAFIKAGGSSNGCVYDGTGWSDASAIDWTGGNIDDYVLTVVRTNGEIKTFVDGKLIATYTSVVIGSTTYVVSSLDSDVQVGLSLCWTKNAVATADTTSATFSDYSFSTDSAAINEYLAAHTA